MKNSFIEIIEDLFIKIQDTHAEINDSYKKLDVKDKSNQLSLGVKMLNLNELSLKFHYTVELFLNVLQGTMEELPEGIQKFFEEMEELKKPAADTDSEDVKKVKEMLNSFKNG